MIDVVELMVQRHEHVERMPGGHYVGDLGVERNPVEWGVRFDEPPVLLLGQLGIHVIKRQDRVIQPRREAPEWGRELGSVADQRGADHLQPGRPGPAPGADHDVTGAVAEAEPPAAVLVMRLIVERGTGHAASVACGPASAVAPEGPPRPGSPLPACPRAARRERLVTPYTNFILNW